MMALMCKFDLESRHLDAVNAFTNAELDELVYVEFPDGFKRFGWVLKLLRALYGLRRSPLLWQKELTTTFAELGLETCSDEPCIQMNDWCIIFFFVDDISILYRQKNEDNVNHLITRLKRHYELTDQENRIDQLRCDLNPTDVSFGVSKLAEHMMNPSSKHHEVMDQMLEYLFATRFFALEFSGDSNELHLLTKPKEIRIATDAAFADNPDSRKSSQGCLITLFNGPIWWNATKQATVTTSSTEAELLAFTHTAKETLSLLRLFKQIDLQLDNDPIIECDNTQTIRLITADVPRVRTALKHVDIHNAWARQTFQEGHFEVEYVPTNQMIADGLTKALPGQAFKAFVQQLGLIDISPRIHHVPSDDEE
ncbi:reverse transcriptase (RNA-dependent DNA polymerase) [Hirsutella rhossiliensis]|uniref:Reverse transcriptase (RNA-dependent DNA polymerase) domain-containing protein n=1 Tax=Hirsutella rhossiliensis TaxID=111463 RepID=A0A9P8MSR6_9HYPO|nr:reverse transcriptase (RNA-dependent DNA polymerase) domain-containing protein [Hirsutella rhossiliensis]KAH0960489.1 reverse transcriptase (RNA-dependent DNA polymerase) domain-containing protein [Hirsutella rhossiliensis]